MTSTILASVALAYCIASVNNNFAEFSWTFFAFTLVMGYDAVQGATILNATIDNCQNAKNIKSKDSLVAALCLDSWTSALFRATNVSMKVVGFAVVLSQITLAITGLVLLNNTDRIVAGIALAYAFVSLTTYLRERSSEFSLALQSYMAVTLLTVLFAYRIFTTEQTTLLAAIALPFVFDTVVGLVLLAKNYQNEIFFYTLANRFGYKMLKSTFKPTITK
jgi:hypothetical protein